MKLKEKRMLMWTCDVTRFNRIMNIYISRSLGVINIVSQEKIRANYRKLFRRRNNIKKTSEIIIAEERRRGRN